MNQTNPTDSPSTDGLADAAARALRGGDAKTAAGLYRQVVEREPKAARHWVSLAVAQRAAGDLDAELQALDEALALEPRLLPALLLKGVNRDDRGDAVGAGETFKAALAVAPPFDRLPPNLQPMVRRAQASVARFQAMFERVVRQELAEAYRDVVGEKTGRFDQAVDVMLGKKPIYRQQPNAFYFPGLPETQFYERDEFPWVGPIEAATDDIRAEFEAVFQIDTGFTPYIQYQRGAPIDQWAELNHSMRWSVLHLIKDGLDVPENAVRCPRTVDLVRGAPGPTLANRSPNAMFSLLNPRTRIPPHTGETNARLVVHIPLIVPNRTGFRVGNETRRWRLGEAFIFNDTIEHEAWNDSDELRVALIFDIWHPALTPAEQVLISRLMTATDVFRGGGAMAL